MAHIQTLSSSIYSYLDCLSFDGGEAKMPSRRAATAGVELTGRHFRDGSLNAVTAGGTNPPNNIGFETSVIDAGGTPTTRANGATAAGTTIAIAGIDSTVTPAYGNVTRMPSIREFPSIGTPANIVNVPVFGQATSAQVQGQADAPNMEITVNYVAREMVKFHSAVAAGTDFAFRFMMVDGSISLINSINNVYTATAAAAAGWEQSFYENNTHFYFEGRVEAILVNPALTDATTAQVTLTAKTAFVGPETAQRRT